MHKVIPNSFWVLFPEGKMQWVREERDIRFGVDYNSAPYFDCQIHFVINNLYCTALSINEDFVEKLNLQYEDLCDVWHKKGFQVIHRYLMEDGLLDVANDTFQEEILGELERRAYPKRSD